MHQGSTLLGAGFIAGLCVAYAGADQVAVLKPVSGQAVYAGSWTIQTPPPVFLQTTEMSPKKALLEYSLAEVPDGATITSASLALSNVYAASGIIAPGGPSQLTFNGYAGNGLIEAADAANPTNPVGATDMLSSGPPRALVLVAIDPVFIQSLLGGSSTHLGLVCSQTGDPTGYVHFESTSGSSPELTLTYTPEPGTAMLLVAGLAGLCCRQRRRVRSSAVG